MHWLRTIKEMHGSTIRVEVMRLDDNRRPVPTGEFETLEADSLVLAVGQETDTTFLRMSPASSSPPTARSSWATTCRPGARACLPAATWCHASGPSRPRWATARRPRGISTPI